MKSYSNNIVQPDEYRDDLIRSNQLIEVGHKEIKKKLNIVVTLLSILIFAVSAVGILITKAIHLI